MALFAVMTRDHRLLDDQRVNPLSVDRGVRLAVGRKRPSQERVIRLGHRRRGRHDVVQRATGHLGTGRLRLLRLGHDDDRKDRESEPHCYRAHERAPCFGVFSSHRRAARFCPGVPTRIVYPKPVLSPLKTECRADLCRVARRQAADCVRAAEAVTLV